MSSSAAFSVQSLGPPPAIRSHWGLAEQSQDSEPKSSPHPRWEVCISGQTARAPSWKSQPLSPLIPFTLEGPWLPSGGPQHGPRTTQGFH